MNGILRRGDPRRAKVLRGSILSLLYLAEQSDPINPDDPTLISREILTISLENLGMLPPNEELHSYLRYLEQKKYIEVSWLSDGSGLFGSVRLLPSGTDLVEGSETDNGVTFRKRR